MIEGGCLLQDLIKQEEYKWQADFLDKASSHDNKCFLLSQYIKLYRGSSSAVLGSVMDLQTPGAGIVCAMPGSGTWEKGQPQPGRTADHALLPCAKTVFDRESSCTPKIETRATHVQMHSRS